MIGTASQTLRLPISTQITQPEPDQTFWVNLIGRGYSAPNRLFRWCTDRMKIQPTSRFIREQISVSGEVILLLGVRRSESAARAASVRRYDNGARLHAHSDLAGCRVFWPIVELQVDDVWEFLATNPPPWGGNHDALIQLYRHAGSGECPVVTSKDDAPACDTTSSRFGCWTCTVVEKDRSLEGFVDAGFAEFGPLLDFRDWLQKIRNDPNRRQARRRNGYITIASTGALIPGPFTVQTRIEILDRLQQIQTDVALCLISDREIEHIKQIWSAEMRQTHDGGLKFHHLKKDQHDAG